jgi:hypothetical protein
MFITHECLCKHFCFMAMYWLHIFFFNTSTLVKLFLLLIMFLKFVYIIFLYFFVSIYLSNILHKQRHICLYITQNVYSYMVQWRSKIEGGQNLMMILIIDTWCYHHNGNFDFSNWKHYSQRYQQSDWFKYSTVALSSVSSLQQSILMIIDI